MPLRQLIELLTPTPCLGCGREGAWLCQGCLAVVERPRAACFACGRLGQSGQTCADCASELVLARATAGAVYEGPVRELVLALKFHHARAAVQPAAELVMRGLAASTAAYDVVTAVPVAPGRRRERGYNQSELVARAVAARLGLPYRTVLRRHGVTHQVGAGRHARFDQVSGAFEAVTSVSGSWLVVDDVLTTGATLEACAKALQAAGAEVVGGAVIAAGQQD